MCLPFNATQTTQEGRQGVMQSAVDFVIYQLVVICSQHCLFYVGSPMEILTEKSNLGFVLDAPQLTGHSITGIFPGFQENGEVLQSLTIKQLEFTLKKNKKNPKQTKKHSILLYSYPKVKVW